MSIIDILLSHERCLLRDAFFIIVFQLDESVLNSGLYFVSHPKYPTVYSSLDMCIYLLHVKQDRVRHTMERLVNSTNYIRGHISKDHSHPNHKTITSLSVVFIFDHIWLNIYTAL